MNININDYNPCEVNSVAAEAAIAKMIPSEDVAFYPLLKYLPGCIHTNNRQKLVDLHEHCTQVFLVLMLQKVHQAEIRA